jgi:hypothetical protein
MPERMEEMRARFGCLVGCVVFVFGVFGLVIVLVCWLVAGGLWLFLFNTLCLAFVSSFFFFFQNNPPRCREDTNATPVVAG